VFATKREAREYINEQEALIDRGFLSGIASKIKVREAIKKYLKEVSIMKSSHQNEEGIWNRLIKNNRAFSELRLAEVRPSHIQHVRNKTARRGRTVANYELKLLNHMFNISIDVWRYLETNPVSHVKKFKTSKGRYAPLYFAEYRRILTEAKSNWSTYLYLLILRNGGFRPKEVHALTHNDIDLIKNLLIVRKQKAQNTYRLVPIKPYIIKLILESKSKHKSNLIIPYGKDTMNSRWQRIKKNLDIVDRQLYDLRRTFAHNFIDYKKGDIAEMCRVGGWSDWEMAHRYYGKDGVRA
jgi:integrase